VTFPRIAAFARLASGDNNPVRVIAGQATKLTRVAHGITYDPLRDEIVATEPLASSIVVFNGGANGEQAPLRVIQGPKTDLHDPWGPSVDDVHHELAVADFTSSAVLVYPWDANGDVAPRREIRGPKTEMRGTSGVAFDPEHDLLVAMTFARGKENWRAGGGIFIFNRTDNGNVKPRAVIAGPRTGIEAGWHLVVYKGMIYAAAPNIDYMPPYEPSGYEPRKGCTGPPPPPLTVSSNLGFIGVWKITDNGDVPPRAILKGAGSQLIAPGSLAINPATGEIYVSDGARNGVFTFLVPQFFGVGS
jgi:DNA-binding beta-propeller fold protein YncE